MIQRHDRGAWAEQIALDYLLDKGLQCREQNFTCRYGEIDIILQSSTHIIFVEVRMRCHNRYGTALASVGYAKQQKIRQAGQYYLQRYRVTQRLSPRFDVVGISPPFHRPIIQWVPDAF